jgi:hypothetical protein
VPLHAPRPTHRQRIAGEQHPLVGHEADGAARGAGDLQPYRDRGVRVDPQPLADSRVLGPAAGRGEGEGEVLGLGDVGVPRADAVLDRLPRQVLGEDDGLGQADRVRVAVGVAVAHRREPLPVLPYGRHERRVPGGEGDLVVGRVGAVPHLDGVRLAEAELPGAADAGGVRMGGDHQAAGPPDLAGELSEAVVARPVAPVDEGAGLGAEGDDVTVARGDLLAQHDQQVVARLRGPMGVRGLGVVLRRVDEVQARRTRQRRDLGGGAAPVRVPGVQVAVTPVPGPTPPLRPLRRVHRPRGDARFAVGERDRELVRQSLRGDGVRAQRHVPGAGVHGAGEVTGRRVVDPDEELRARPARPAPETPAAQVRAVLVEDADVEGVALGAGRDGRLVVRVGHLDLVDPRGDLDGHVHIVGRAGRERAPYRPRLLGTACRGCRTAREGHASQRKRGGGARHDQRASAGAVSVIVVAHAAAPGCRE